MRSRSGKSGMKFVDALALVGARAYIVGMSYVPLGKDCHLPNDFDRWKPDPNFTPVTLGNLTRTWKHEREAILWDRGQACRRIIWPTHPIRLLRGQLPPPAES